MKSEIKGALIVEMALVLPLFLLVIFNAFFGALMLYDEHCLSTITVKNAREAAIDAATSLQTDFSVGSGIRYGNADNRKRKISDQIEDRLILYKVETVSVVAEGNVVQVDKENHTSQYTMTKIDDANIIVNVKVERKDFVPIIATALCPTQLGCKRKMHIELHIDKNLIVNPDLFDS